MFGRKPKTASHVFGPAANCKVITPSGAVWSDSAEDKPHIPTLAVCAVWVCPRGVALIAHGRSLMLDGLGYELGFSAEDGVPGHSEFLGLSGLTRLAAELPAALLNLNEGADECGCKLACGISISKQEPNLLRVVFAGTSLLITPIQCWRYAAEVTALLTRVLETQSSLVSGVGIVGLTHEKR